MATTTKDVEMKDVDAKEKPQQEKEKEKTPAELEAMLLAGNMIYWICMPIRWWKKSFSDFIFFFF